MDQDQRRPLLQLCNLRKTFGNVVAVDDVSLDIQDGEFITLLGPSGSGKTTILNMIAGFETPTAGEIVLQGRPINLLLPEKRNIGMVFQNYALFPHMTIFDNIAFPLKMRRVSKKEIGAKVKRALELVQLEGYEHRYPRQLSGGQQQRVALARALVFDPPLLLLDEPLGALDKKLRAHMQLELKHIHTRLNRTMIYVTHDQEEALVMSDRIAVMNHGRIAQVGSPDELYERPESEFVASFVGESNIIRGKVREQAEGSILLEISQGSGLRLGYRGESLPLGKELSFSIRPEKIFMVGPDYEGWSIEAVIEETIYVGETRRYRVTVEGLVLHLREMNIQVGQSHSRGEKVRLSWFEDSLRRVR